MNTIKAKVTSAKVITGKVCFSYANVWEPKSINGSPEKFSVSIIIPKTDIETISKVNGAIEYAKKEGISKLGNVSLNDCKIPLRDGDIEMPDNEAYKDSYFINANSYDKPQKVDKSLKPITNRNEFYSGCFGRASITFYAYNINGNKGIACGLGNLQKFEDGKPLGGRSKAEDEFGIVEEADDFLS